MFLEFCMELCEIQYKGGRYFVHEHPWGAVSWEEQSVMKVKSLPDNDVEGRVLKPTGWMTNSPAVARRVGVLSVRARRAGASERRASSIKKSESTSRRRGAGNERLEPC